MAQHRLANTTNCVDLTETIATRLPILANISKVISNEPDALPRPPSRQRMPSPAPQSPYKQPERWQGAMPPHGQPQRNQCSAATLLLGHVPPPISANHQHGSPSPQPTKVNTGRHARTHSPASTQCLSAIGLESQSSCNPSHSSMLCVTVEVKQHAT